MGQGGGETAPPGRNKKGNRRNSFAIIKLHQECLQKQKKVNPGTSTQKGEGGTRKIPNSYQLPIWDITRQEEVLKGLCPQVCSDVLLRSVTFIFNEVFATKAFNITVFTDKTNYYRACSHKLHNKKRNILFSVFFEFFIGNFENFKTC